MSCKHLVAGSIPATGSNFRQGATQRRPGWVLCGFSGCCFLSFLFLRVAQPGESVSFGRIVSGVRIPSRRPALSCCAFQDRDVGPPVTIQAANAAGAHLTPVPGCRPRNSLSFVMMSGCRSRAPHYLSMRECFCIDPVSLVGTRSDDALYCGT